MVCCFTFVLRDKLLKGMVFVTGLAFLVIAFSDANRD